MATPPTHPDDKAWNDAIGSMSPRGKLGEAGTREPLSTILSARVWDVVGPPPVNSVKGHFVPCNLVKYQRYRRISVEVRRFRPAVNEENDANKLSPHLNKSTESELELGKKKETQGYDECFISILVPATLAARSGGKEAGRGAEGGGDTDSFTLIPDDDSLIPLQNIAVSSNWKGGSLGDIPEGGEAKIIALPPSANSQWVEKYCFPLYDVVLKKRVKKSCILCTRLGDVDQTREIIFDAEEEAIAFSREIEKCIREEATRRKQRRNITLGGIRLKDENEKLDFLIDIVSGTALPAADMLSSDPMVKVVYNGKTIHETKFVPKTLNPVWTIKTHSLCLLSVTAKELFDSRDGLTFLVVDFDKFGRNESLGAVVLSPKEVYLAKGERIEHDLKPMFGEKDYGTGKLAVRIRRASDYDMEFMRKFHEEDKKALMHKTVAARGGKSMIASILTKTEKIEKRGHGDKKTEIKKLKIRPGPDPKRKEVTTWMTEEGLSAESMKGSQHWIDIGSGNLGRVYLEIIGCDGLPQLDSGALLGNKTDAFVSIVYEDSITKTDVIDDTLRPRWMPWSKRAFHLHMMHPSSQLFLGVFDYDEGIFDDHDLVGRVSVDLTGFYPDTEYLLTYNIFPTAKTSYTREAMGTITFRLRIEYFDERQMVLTNLRPPPDVHVNQKHKKDFRCARYTTFGKYEMDVYSIETISSYMEEIMAYLLCSYYIEDGIKNVMLWRGHFPLCLMGIEILLPIHSLTLFLCLIFLIERPTYVPSFCCAGVAWFLLAVMGYRRNSPNPWDQVRSFSDALQMIILGKANSTPENIKPYENVEAAASFHKTWEKRIVDAEKLVERRRQQAVADQEEWEREIEEIGEAGTDISTKVGGGGIGASIDPLKLILFPIQQYLSIACNILRFVKNVVIWEEYYIAALICIASVVSAIAFAFVPWFFLIQWTSRIVVWLLFGPWMKLVDVFYISKLKPLTKAELNAQEAQTRQERKDRTADAALRAKITREDTTKLKAMRKHMFGKFIFKVPILKVDRFRDIPLPSSSATPYIESSLPLSELAMKEAGKNRTRVTGQLLTGRMIPKFEAGNIMEAPTGQAAGKRDLLDKESSAANVERDSTANAVTKISGAVVMAATVTWFGVPFVINAVKFIW